MDKLALRVAMFTVGMHFVFPRLADAFGVHLSQLLVLGLCLPAVMLGSMSFWRVASFGRSWPVVLCVAVAWIGLAYGAGRTNNRGLLNVAYVTSTLPIAALIVERRCWWLCARMFVIGSAFAMCLAIWFEYVLCTSGIVKSLYRFGNLWSADGDLRLANPNLIGNQLALAAVLALVLYLRDGNRRKAHQGTAAPAQFSLAWTLLLSMGCMLTASRGAFVSWAGGMTILVLWGMDSRQSRKARDLVAFCGVMFAVMLFVAAATGFQPWQTLQARLESPEKLLSASGRLPIWISAYELWTADLKTLLFGLGTGLVPETLGAYLGHLTADGVTTLPTDTHNSFVEWGLSFGLLGMVAGVCLLWGVFRRTRLLDRRDGIVYRQAILVCFCTASMTYVTVFYIFFCAAGPLILAMLSDPPPSGPAAVAHRPHRRPELVPAVRHVRTAPPARQPNYGNLIS